MQFSKLRLTGFKSFVDPTELDILPGVTGVVGPNGCGKSNLVEALKWVMGETSAKQMRGGDMDDVIFAGSRNRPARNIAEVGLGLDNSNRNAPAQFNQMDELDVTRKIEREKGSTYRVNSKEVRAKDVHLLFADSATGARSTALVSQGQIGEIVSAKPAQRRKLLEEAAGISGLHTRRHEAELRLRGAETNLERLDDVMITLDGQMLTLRKQARQAKRYRNLNDHIRKAEATLLLIQWNSVNTEINKSQEALKIRDETVTNLTRKTSSATIIQNEAADHLPQLRNTEVEAAAVLQRLNLARENLEEEKTRLIQQKEECENRLKQISQDIERERNLTSDAEAATRNLEEEKLRITDFEANQGQNISNAGYELAKIREEYANLETQLGTLTQESANEQAKRNDLEQRKKEVKTRLSRLQTEEKQSLVELEKLETNITDKIEIDKYKSAFSFAQESQDQMRKYADEMEETRILANQNLTTARNESQIVLTETNKLQAEIKALTEILETGDPDQWPPLIDTLSVEPGLETALGAALGEDLGAATSNSAPVHWRSIEIEGDRPKLPGKVRPLSNYVSGSSIIVSRLSQIGIVDDIKTGWDLFPKLKQGQRLVTRNGDFWRWDGYTSSAEASTTVAIKLQQRNRLIKAEESFKNLQEKVQLSQSLVEEADKQFEAAMDNEKKARAEARNAELTRDKAQQEMTQINNIFSETDAKIISRKEALERITVDIQEATTILSDLNLSELSLSKNEETEIKLSELRVICGDKREELVAGQTRFDTLNAQQRERQDRLKAITSQITNWSMRKSEAKAQLEERTQRKVSIEEQRRQLDQKPEILETNQRNLDESITGAEEKRRAAADQLAEAETKLRGAEKDVRELEGALSRAREERIRSEANLDQLKINSKSLEERMTERLDCNPSDLTEITGVDDPNELPNVESAEKRVERLLRERENMGPVNLLAESEASELEEQIETLQSEREDLITAIGKLRRSISELNREGRQRLLKSFEEVNTHFKKLFVRLFGGGRAHLELIESDDPLEAGLEIMASPPGKRLQVLSLLSGGEQALTALSLLFSVFMCNPAPICVLDEVDAPLDDSNVDRFCTLVDEMANTLSTRFLVITHHRMTMARMDRLFGVTMGEQGVSQLVSVDLGKAIELRESA